jgi:hypothetical protein
LREHSSTWRGDTVNYVAKHVRSARVLRQWLLSGLVKISTRWSARIEGDLVLGGVIGAA